MGIINNDEYYYGPTDTSISNTYISLAEHKNVSIQKGLEGYYSVSAVFDIFKSQNHLTPLYSFGVYVETDSQNVGSAITLLYNKLKLMFPNYTDC